MGIAFVGILAALVDDIGILVVVDVIATDIKRAMDAWRELAMEVDTDIGSVVVWHTEIVAFATMSNAIDARRAIGLVIFGVVGSNGVFL